MDLEEDDLELTGSVDWCTIRELLSTLAVIRIVAGAVIVIVYSCLFLNLTFSSPSMISWHLSLLNHPLFDDIPSSSLALLLFATISLEFADR